METSAWIGTLSALGGVVLAGGIGLLRDIRSDRKRQQDQQLAQRHAVSEARYETRRAAHVTFSAVLFAEIEKVHDFMDAHGDQTPGDYQHEGPIAALDEPFNLVRIIGPSDVAEAAHKARYELNWWAFGNGSAAEATKAAEQYLDSARRLLKFDID